MNASEATFLIFASTLFSVLGIGTIEHFHAPHPWIAYYGYGCGVVIMFIIRRCLLSLEVQKK